jgi:4-aminobutyrate aminotransferase
MHMCGSDFYYEPMIALATRLARIAPGQDAKRVFLTNSGTEATEAAIKLSRYHTGRRAIIAFQGAFHGRTMGSLSLSTSKAKHRSRFGPFVPMIEHAPYGDLKALREVVLKRFVDPDEVAAIFVEPILGEGGYVLPPEGFLPGLRELCDQHGILLVFDEIQTGMGRTGKMFCCEHEGVVPDILLLAKGLGNGMPIGAVVARHDVMDWTPGSHGSTFGGNPISCAAALVTIDLIEKQMLTNVNHLGPVALGKLKRLSDKHSVISDARGRGLMLAVDVVKDSRTRQPDPELRDRILNEAFGRGLLLLGCGDHAIRFIPPLCINRVQLEVGLDVFDEVVATVAG